MKIFILYHQVPSTSQEWSKIAKQFAQVWNFPRCCGAIDGKHVHIKQPPGSGADFFNFKGFYSTVLLALVDGDYNFIYVNIGVNGRSNDAGIFSSTTLYKGLEDGTLNLPPDHVILGDSAFPLKTYLMKPFSVRNAGSKQCVFNYRLSRARRIVENAFGILTWCFRIFTRPIELKTTTIDELVYAACSLHNWLRSRSPSYITAAAVDQEDPVSGELIPGQWRQEINALTQAVPRMTNNYTTAAKAIRQQYANHFWTDGAISTQWRATGVNPHDSASEGEEGDEDIEEPDAVFENAL